METRILLFAMLFMIGVGCQRKEIPKPSEEKTFFQNDITIQNTLRIKNMGRVLEVVIDSCEYIVLYPTTRNGSIIHKENCEFCTKRKNNNHDRTTISTY